MAVAAHTPTAGARPPTIPVPPIVAFTNKTEFSDEADSCVTTALVALMYLDTVIEVWELGDGVRLGASVNSTDVGVKDGDDVAIEPCTKEIHRKTIVFIIFEKFDP